MLAVLAGPRARQVLVHLAQSGPLDDGQLAERVEMSVEEVRDLLQALTRVGLVENVGADPQAGRRASARVSAELREGFVKLEVKDLEGASIRLRYRADEG